MDFYKKSPEVKKNRVENTHEKWSKRTQNNWRMCCREAVTIQDLPLIPYHNNHCTSLLYCSFCRSMVDLATSQPCQITDYEKLHKENKERIYSSVCWDSTYIPLPPSNTWRNILSWYTSTWIRVVDSNKRSWNR